MITAPSPTTTWLAYVSAPRVDRNGEPLPPTVRTALVIGWNDSGWPVVVSDRTARARVVVEPIACRYFHADTIPLGQLTDWATTVLARLQYEANTTKESDR